jgi:hypothetical protein
MDRAIDVDAHFLPELVITITTLPRRYKMVRFLSALVLLLQASTMVDAGVYQCQNVLEDPPTCVTSVGGSEELCYYSSGFGASICSGSVGSDAFGNETEVIYYCGSYGWGYSFKEELDGMETQIEFDQTNLKDIERYIASGVVPNATKNNGTGYVEPVYSKICNAMVNGELCNSCISCDDGSIEADCTNLDLGRKVECGETYEECDSLPFFPFLDEKVKKMKVSASNTGALTSSLSFLATIMTLVVVGLMV